MGIAELEPGLYKVIKQPPGSRRSRMRGSVHLLRVIGYGKKRQFLIDHMMISSGLENFLQNEAADYEVIARINTPTVRKPRLTITWCDDAGDEFSFTVANSWHLRDVFEMFPWLKEPFGFKQRGVRG